MRYLRMLTNALLAGGLFAVYVAIIFLQVNPHVPLAPQALWPLLAIIIGFYGVHAAALFYILIVLWQLASREVLSPGWLSLRLLSWLAAAASAGAALLMWLNLRGLNTALAEESARRLGVGAIAMGLSALALLTIAVVHYSFGRRGSVVGASLYALAVLASVTLPTAARGPAVAQPIGAYPLEVGNWSVPTTDRTRIEMLLLDGASLDYLSLATSEGRLPSFGRLPDAGAAMHLATLRPTQPGPVWASVATGKYPPHHGVISTSTYGIKGQLARLDLLPDYCFAQALVFLGLLEEAPASSAALGARPLWNVLSGQGVHVGIVGWPLTHPVQPVSGFLVSDRFHVIGDPAVDPAAGPAAYPEAAAAIGTAAIRRLGGWTPAAASAAHEEGGLAPPAEAAPIWRDRAYERVAEALRVRYQNVRLLAVRYRGLDLAGHRFLSSGTPLPLLDANGRRGDADSLDEYYRQIDSRVETMLDRLGPDDLLLVVSPFGMEPASLLKRGLAWLLGDPDMPGTHERAPDGFMLAYGAHVEPGRRARGAVVDVAPTILYYLGVPVARDIDGVARTDLFVSRFTKQHPIAFVPSYER